MSVINQVLQDLDARKSGGHGDEPVWTIEPPAVSDAPRRMPALTLTVPVIAIAVAALFGQGSWGWQLPAATASGATHAAGSVGGTADAGVNAVANTRGMIAGVALPVSSMPAGSAPSAMVTTIAALRSLEPVERIADPAPSAQGRPGAESSAATPSALAPGRVAAPPAQAASHLTEPTAGAAATLAVPPSAAATTAWPAMTWLTAPAASGGAAKAPAGTNAPPVANAPAVANAAASSALATAQTAGPTLASIATPTQASAARAPAANSRDATPAASAAPATLQIERTSLGPIATGRADGHFRNAMLRYHAGQLDESARLLQAALAEEPRHTASRQALAAMLIDRRDYAQAQAVLLEGLALDPTQGAFATMAARLFVRQGDLDAAARTLQAAAGERATPELQATLADVLSRLRRDNEALVHWNSALQRSPAHAGWWLGLAVSLESVGRGHDARTAYERALSLPGLKADAADYARERLASAR